MKQEIKPCPFCGGEAVLIMVQTCGYVRCIKCLATSTFDRKQEVIDAWNKRTIYAGTVGGEIVKYTLKELENEDET